MQVSSFLLRTTIVVRGFVQENHAMKFLSNVKGGYSKSVAWKNFEENTVKINIVAALDFTHHATTIDFVARDNNDFLFM